MFADWRRLWTGHCFGWLVGALDVLFVLFARSSFVFGLLLCLSGSRRGLMVGVFCVPTVVHWWAAMSLCFLFCVLPLCTFVGPAWALLVFAVLCQLVIAQGICAGLLPALFKFVRGVRKSTSCF